METAIEKKEIGSAQQIKAVFEPMTEALERMEPEYNEIIAMEVNEESAKKAKVLRLLMVKARTAADKKRKEQKEYFLQAGRAIDGAFNIFKAAVSPKEDRLKDIELFEERRIEAEQKQLQEDREAELRKYDFDGSTMDLGRMEPAVWTNFLTGTKSNYEAVQKAEKDAADQKKKEDRQKAVKDARLKRLFKMGLVFNGDSLVYEDINFHHTDVLCMTDGEFDKAAAGAEERKKVIDKTNIVFEDRKKILLPYAKYGALERLFKLTSLEGFTELKVEMIQKKRADEEEQSRVQKENQKLKGQQEEDRQKEIQREKDKKAADNAPDKEKLEKIIVYLDDHICKMKTKQGALALANAILAISTQMKGM